MEHKKFKRAVQNSTKGMANIHLSTEFDKCTAEATLLYCFWLILAENGMDETKRKLFENTILYLNTRVSFAIWI